MTLTLLDWQKERLGRLIWSHIDGVASNVMPLLTAINQDVTHNVMVVARDEWERCQSSFIALQAAIETLESRLHDLSPDQVLTLLQSLKRREH